MVFENDYHEIVDTLDGVLLNIFKGLQRDFRKEIDIIKKNFPSQDVVIPDQTLRLHFRDAVKILNDANFTENGKPIPDDEDFSTTTERKLGALVKEKYNTD